MRTTTTIVCVAALSACSGATPYSSTYNAADHDFAAETTPHLRSAIEFADVAAVSDEDPAVRRAAAEWARLARAEVRAIDGVIGAVRDPLSAAEAEEHLRIHPGTAFPDASDEARGPAVLERLLESNRAAVQAASDYRRRGRQPSLKSIAGWIIEDRTAESETLQALLEGAR
jgi:uncharacterized protein (DUF305 family)